MVEAPAAYRRELAAQCAQLCFTEFKAAYLDLGFPTVESALDDLRESCMNGDRIPIVLVCCDAAKQSRLLGTVTLEARRKRAASMVRGVPTSCDEVEFAGCVR